MPGSRTRFTLGAGVLLAALVLACGDSDVESLDVVTHDSFDISEELIARFEEEHNAKIKLI